MTLRQFLEAKGFAHPGKDKCFCLWHADRKPSAYLNSNNIYCFSCGRVYGLRDFEEYFDVVLDRVPEESGPQVKAGYSYNQVLFEFPFMVRGGECV